MSSQELAFVALDPGVAEILKGARVSLRDGDVSGASNRYSSLVAAHPDDPWLAILYQETRYQFAQELSEEEAEALVENLRSSYRGKAEASPTPISLLLAARSETDPYAALYLAERSLVLDSTFAWGSYARAHSLSQLGKMEAAKAEVERAIKLDPGLLPAWRLLAWLRSRAGERDLAIETWGLWLEAVSEDPRVSGAVRSEAICDLGVLLVRAKRHEEAMVLLDSALVDLEQFDLTSRSSSILAAAASEIGALEEALAALRVARESDPLELLFIVQEALLLERLEPHSEAVHAAWTEVIEQTQDATSIGALLQRTRAEAHLAAMMQDPLMEGGGPN